MIDHTNTRVNKELNNPVSSCGWCISRAIRRISFFRGSYAKKDNKHERVCLSESVVLIAHKRSGSFVWQPKELVRLSRCYYCSSSSSGSSGSSSGSQNKGDELRKLPTKWCTSWRSSSIRSCFVVVDGFGCIDELVYDVVQLLQDEIFPEILQPHPKFNFDRFFVFCLLNFDIYFFNAFFYFEYTLFSTTTNNCHSPIIIKVYLIKKKSKYQPDFSTFHTSAKSIFYL